MEMATKPPKPEAKVEAVQSHAGLIQTLKTRQKGRSRSGPIIAEAPLFTRGFGLPQRNEAASQPNDADSALSATV
jgi:hypothetical protein